MDSSREINKPPVFKIVENSTLRYCSSCFKPQIVPSAYRPHICKYCGSVIASQFLIPRIITSLNIVK